MKIVKLLIRCFITVPFYIYMLISLASNEFFRFLAFIYYWSGSDPEELEWYHETFDNDDEIF